GPKWAAFAKFVGATGEGVRQAGHVLKRGDPRVIAGSLGYWFFDNLVLWATFHAIGTTPPFTVVLMAYLIGQLGGLLPIPGGIGGIDGGLIGTFIVYGVAAAPTAAAVLAYRLILFWLPLAVGAVAFGLGVAAGLAVPESDQEDKLFGATSDKVTGRAEQMASQAVDKAEQKVESTLQDLSGTSSSQRSQQSSGASS
ncbi:MAG TPA: flippase-like domain-containing protein, partial [Nitrolancea sp.]|nr:flippase-like domain-containing protein [Nitrolancea sp.]